MDRGVVYVATGHKYLQEALLSAESVKRHMRHLSITLYTDEDVDSRHVDEVVHFDADGYLSRIPRLAASPYERTLFLDSDTYVCGDLEPLFALLDGFDIALAHAPVRAIYEIDGVPDSFPEFNAGVILFRQSADVRAVFSDWEALFDNFRGQVSRDEVRWLCAPEQRIYAHDQGALRQALYPSKLRIATLPPEYNCRFSVPGYVDGPVKILHGRGFDPAAVEAAINSISRRRGYHERGGKLRLSGYLVPSSATYSLANLRYTLRRHGLWWTANAAMKRLRAAGRAM